MKTQRVKHPPVRRQVLFPRAKLDADALIVVSRLKRHGHQAYLVGGCVRDLLLGRRPKDFDVATDATPEEVKALFRRRCRIIGRRFRLAHVHFGPKIIETATFRANPHSNNPSCDTVGTPGSESERPDEPAASTTQPLDLGPSDSLLIKRDNVFGSAEEDALRRDFTINGLFYDPQTQEVIDYVQGLADIEARLVRTIGDPEIRFREDPVRILRAIKFAARLDMTIEERTHDAMITFREQIRYCAKARVFEEIRRLLSEGASRASIDGAQSVDVLEVLSEPVAKALETPVLAGRIRKRLAAADRMKRSGIELSRALVFTNLVTEILGRDWMNAADPSRALDQRLTPILADMNTPKRDMDRARKILMLQRRLLSRKSRRPSMARSEAFPEALQLFELAHMAGLIQERETLDYWKKRLRIPRDRRGGRRR